MKLCLWNNNHLLINGDILMHTLFKFTIICALLCGLAIAGIAQTRQTQAILDAWDTAVITEIFLDTITSEIQYSDTIRTDRWVGSPRRFYLFMELDSTDQTDQVSFSAAYELALDTTGPFYATAGALGGFPESSMPFLQTGKWVFVVSPYGAPYMRFAFSCNDTLFLHAYLWMQH